MIATVTELWRYPVKSMAGEQIEQGVIYWYGLEGDRRYAFVHSGHPGRFPWLTARDVPDLVRYRPRLLSNDVVNGPLEVTTPDGRQLPIGSSELAAVLTRAMPGNDIHLMQLNRGTFDAAPLSLMSEATAEKVARVHGQPLDRRRYRQNIWLKTEDGQPYSEESLCGRRLRLGDRPDSAELLVNRPIPRCQMVNVDPSSAEVDPNVLKAVVRSNDNCLGIYASVAKPGSVHRGDPVFVIE